MLDGAVLGGECVFVFESCVANVMRLGSPGFCEFSDGVKRAKIFFGERENGVWSWRKRWCHDFLNNKIFRHLFYFHIVEKTHNLFKALVAF